MLTVLGGLAEFERELIRPGLRKGASKLKRAEFDLGESSN
jgi:DNA invertase Pin-like site-specific DNA recombinase